MYRAGILILFTAILMNCAGNKPQPDWSGTQYFNYAKDLFEDEDYYEASREFTVVVLRYAGTHVADSAQYYLAESHYMMDEYLIAAVEYEKLINSMSRSPLVPRAQFKLAKSYYELSPRAALDQQYTDKAIRHFQMFIEDYPQHELVTEAEKHIAMLRDKLAKKAYDSGEIYRKMREYDAAIIYFDQVLEKFYDTAYADDAVAGKAKTYLEMKDFDLAKKEIEKFTEQFPESDLKEKITNISEEIAEEVETD